MNKVKKIILLFLAAFTVSSAVSVFAITRPVSLSDYDGSLLKEAASSQLGEEGGEKYWRWCGFDSRVDWCACFISWCLDQCYDGCPKMVSCAELLQWLKGMSMWYGNDITPSPGMIVLFDGDGNHRPEHVGIVDCLKDGRVYVIEGNSNDRCALNSYILSSPIIYGYGAVCPEA